MHRMHDRFMDRFVATAMQSMAQRSTAVAIASRM
jgi:hypothetical protein